MANALSHQRFPGAYPPLVPMEKSALYRAFLGTLGKLFYSHDRIVGDTQVAIPPRPAHLAGLSQDLVLYLRPPCLY